MTNRIRRIAAPIAAAVALLAATGSAMAALVIADPTPQALPPHPFFASMSVLNKSAAVGPAAGHLGVTNLTLTNFDTSQQQVFIFSPVFASGTSCSGSIIGGSSPQLTVYVQASSTLVIPYPTPLEFTGKLPSCLAAEVTTVLHGGSVEVDVTGYYQ